MQHITGTKARELLDAATPGPWLALRDPHHHPEDCEWTVESNAPHLDSPPAVVDFDGVTQGARDANLIAAAPALAETVAWLYEGNSKESTGEYSVDYLPGQVLLSSPGVLGPGEAVEFARALLAAAEEAGRG